MTDEGCHALCLGLGLHFPYYLNPAFSMAKVKRNTIDCFSPVQKESFAKYREYSLMPSIESSLEWLDSGSSCAFSISGTLIEQLENEESDALNLLVQAATHRHSEILGQTYYHSVAGLFSEKNEFLDQVGHHADLMQDRFGRRPIIFENTEFVFDSDLAGIIHGLGFSALYYEGYDHILFDRNPNFMYSCRGLPVLLRNCRLSDDIAHRFHDRNWDQYPLSPEKFSSWVARTPGDCIHLFLDAQVFRREENQAEDLRRFFGSLADTLQSRGVTPVLPSDALRYPIRGELELEDLGLCNPDGTCTLTGIQNMYQQSALWCLERAKNLMVERETWCRLQSTDHFSRMAIKSGSCGRTVFSCSSQEANEYFTTYMNVLAHCESLSEKLKRSRLASRALRCLPPEKAFHFSTGFRYTGYSAHCLEEFTRVLEFVPADVFSFHQERGDFSRWIREVLGDATLARRVEKCAGAGEAAEIVIERVHELCRRLK